MRRVGERGGSIGVGPSINGSVGGKNEFGDRGM